MVVMVPPGAVITTVAVAVTALVSMPVTMPMPVSMALVVTMMPVLNQRIKGDESRQRRNHAVIVIRGCRRRGQR